MIKKQLAKITFILSAIVMSVPGYSQSIDTTKFYVLTNVAVGEGKAVTGMVSATIGNAAMLRGAIEHPMQQWIIELTQYGTCRLYCREHGRGYALEVVNEGSNSNKVSLGRTHEYASQLWRLFKERDGNYRISSLWQGTEKSLDYVKDGENAFKLVLTETSSDKKSQSWRLVGIPKPKPAPPTQVEPTIAVSAQPLLDTAGVYKLTCQFRGNDFAMEAVMTEGNIKPMLRANASSSAQQWKFKLYPNGVYRLVNRDYSDKSLDVINDGKLNYNLTLAATGNYSGQYWKLLKNDDGSFRLTSIWQPTKSLDVMNAGNKDELIINTSGKYSGQLWSIVKEEPVVKVQPAPKVEETPQTPIHDKLMPEEELLPGANITSPNGKYSLILQEDGNLVFYLSKKYVLWASGVLDNQISRCVMQPGGNIVVYNANNLVMWALNTHGHEGAYLVAHDHGDLVLYSKEGSMIWHTDSSEK